MSDSGLGAAAMEEAKRRLAKTELRCRIVWRLMVFDLESFSNMGLSFSIRLRTLMKAKRKKIEERRSIDF